MLIRTEMIALADALAPGEGYNLTPLEGVRLLRTSASLEDVPVLYRPGAVFVLRGRKEGSLDQKAFRYDEEHYLAVAVPVPFRMRSIASKERPLLAVYVDFDLAIAAEIAGQVARHHGARSGDRASSLVSSPIGSAEEDVLLRLLRALRDPLELAVLGPGLLRELHYRVLIGPQGGAMIAALSHNGATGRIVQSLARLREGFRSRISVTALARDAGMSVPTYHAHFKALTGSTPMQYLKAMRLHEARLMIARQDRPIAEIAASVGYASPAQFSRDFKRRFRRTASEEASWILKHLGNVG